MISSLTSRFDRLPRRVFYLTSEKLTAYQWQDGVLSEAFDFEHTEQGVGNFQLYLETSPRTPVYLLLDVVDEEYKRDSIPHVFGKDRRELIEFRKSRAFRDTEFSYAEIQGREEGGRRDDRVLFAAIVRPELVSPWVEKLHAQKIPLAGVYSLPLLSAELFAPMEVEGDYVLLISQQESGSLRQSYFHKGKLQLSRLAFMPEQSREDSAAYVLSEAEKLRRYLHSLRLLPRDAMLNVYILATDEDLPEYESRKTETALVKQSVVGLSALAQRLGMELDNLERCKNNIFPYLLLHSRPRNHYATGLHTSYFKLHRARITTIVASVVVMLASVVWSGLAVVEGLVTTQRGEAVSQQAKIYRQRYNEARQGLPETPAEPDQLKRVVDMAEALVQRKAIPLPMMNLVSLGLSRYDDLQLDEIDWVVSADPNTTVGSGVTDVSVRKRRSRSSQPEDEEEPGLYQLALVKGHISPFDGNYRRALETVRGFAGSLERHKAVKSVKVVSLPLNVQSHSSLQGDADSRTEQDNPQFSIRVVMRQVHG